MINPTYKTVLTKEPVYATRGVNDSRFIKVLEIMLYGVPIKLRGNYYELTETEKGGFMPIMMVNPEERLVQGVPDMAVQEFSELVAEIPEEKDKTASMAGAGMDY